MSCSFYLFLKYNRTIKKGVTSPRKEGEHVICYYFTINFYLDVLLMTKYLKCEVSSQFVEQKMITIKITQK